MAAELTLMLHPVNPKMNIFTPQTGSDGNRDPLGPPNAERLRSYFSWSPTTMSLLKQR